MHCITILFALSCSLFWNIQTIVAISQAQTYEIMTLETALSKFVITRQRNVTLSGSSSQPSIFDNRMPCALQCTGSENCRFYVPENEQCVLFEFDSDETALSEFLYEGSQDVYAKTEPIGKLRSCFNF